jgi:hypothetical protein
MPLDGNRSRQIDDLEFRIDGVDEARGVGAKIDDAGLQAGQDVGAAAELPDAEHLDFDGAGGAVGDVLGKALQNVVERMVLGVGKGQLERMGRRRSPSRPPDEGHRHRCGNAGRADFQKLASFNHDAAFSLIAMFFVSCRHARRREVGIY